MSDLPVPSKERVFLQVRGGKMAFQRAILSPPSTFGAADSRSNPGAQTAAARLRVGRTTLSDFVIATDEQLSQSHFEIVWDGVRCTVKDLGGAGGLFVGGEAKTEAQVRSGAWIRAGQTDFSVFFEQNVAPRVEGLSDDTVRIRKKALSVLSEVAENGRLFAVLDAARNDNIVRMLQRAGDFHDSIYEGLRAETMEDAAPYVVHFEKQSRLLPRLILEGWQDAFGIYVESADSLKDLRAHFRRIIMVTREKDSLPMYFRFYDPRVLRGFLPIATARQVDVLFGPVGRFLMESHSGGIRAFGRNNPGELSDQTIERH